MRLSKDYFKELEKRSKGSHVYKDFQLTGLEVSQLLGDEKHKALYIKLAKTLGSDLVLRKAKEVTEMKNVKNRGAYFMALIKKK